MCGIVGIVTREEIDLTGDLLNVLEKLEYRGYDSSGVAYVNSDGVITAEKSVGKLVNLKKKIADIEFNGRVGIGHTRWATHGRPCEENAHPILSRSVAVVHNGIIENYKELKFDLEKNGYVFQSDTDTEVIAHMLQKGVDAGLTSQESLFQMLKLIRGSFAIAAMFAQDARKIFAARNKSPVAIGFGQDRMIIGSDALSLCELSDEVVYLEDGDCAEVTCDKVTIFDKNLQIVDRERHKHHFDTASICKGGYNHFMLKEIVEQPNSIRNTILHNKIPADLFENISSVLILACGTSYYAGMVGKYWFERFLKIHTDVEIASEFRYRSPVINDNTLVIAISQSGETLDTLAAIEFIKSNHNCTTIAIVNVRNSAIARIADTVLYTEAGVEIGVASTKAFTAQLTILASIAFGNNDFLIKQLHNLPTICEEVLELSSSIEDVAESIHNNTSALYLGRCELYPVALEGALKLKEISYIHAEGLAAGEMKHGPIALIDEKIPIICLSPYGEMFEKTLSNINEAFARGKNIIVFTCADGQEFIPKELKCVVLPKIHSALTPILYSIPLQLLAYYTAVFRKTDVDRPRNLAKSVTVE